MYGLEFGVWGLGFRDSVWGWGWRGGGPKANIIVGKMRL